MSDEDERGAARATLYIVALRNLNGTSTDLMSRIFVTLTSVGMRKLIRSEPF